MKGRGMITHEVRLSQHADASVEGDVIGLYDDGTFIINRYDGITKLTPAQAREVATMLLQWADAEEAT